MFIDLTEDNFLMFAMKSYTNNHCTDMLEFYDDLKRIRYIKRLFFKYKKTGDLKERLILNHLMVLYNTFDPRSMTKMLIFELHEYLDCIKPFLILLNFWNTDVGLIRGNKVVDSNIPLDIRIVETLRQI
jgi:hypothetical protein